MRYLDRVVDINFYPTDEAGTSNNKWRPVGLGLMGLQDVFFKLKLPFDSDEARAMSARISEEIYFNALWASTELAEASGPHAGFDETRAAEGRAAVRPVGRHPIRPGRWQALRDRIAAHGLRNSLLIAIAPTATIASIAGCYECIEPQVSNLFKRETLSGEFLQINDYLVRDLQALGLWTERRHRRDQEGGGLDPGHRGDPRGHQGALPHGVGAPDAVAHRHGGRARAVHRPEPVAEPLRGVADHRQAQFDVPLRLEERAQDHVLPALPAGDADQQDDGVGVGRDHEAGRRRPSGGEPAAASPLPAPKKTFTEEEAMACSLENPESCEACQ